MSSPARAAVPPLTAIQRYFEVSLYLLVATGMIAVVATGKLDLFTTVVAPTAVGYKAIRVWRRRGPEISTTTATWLVLAYFFFFPVDLWVFSRDLAAGAPNPALYASLLAAIHLLLFATLVRLYSARYNRDYVFLALLAFASILASAILTVDTAFLASLAVFLVLAVSTFVGLEIRRSSEGAATPTMEAGSQSAQRLNRVLGLTSILVAVSTLLLGGGIFFLIPRFTAGYMSALNLQPTLISGFSDNVTLGEIGQIKKSSAVVMRIRVEGNPARAQDVRWRGITLTNFDGRRWFTPSPDPVVISPDPMGNFRFAAGALPLSGVIPLHYTVLMEPIAADAIFLAARPAELRGRFGPLAERGGNGAPRSYLVLDRTGSIFNPYHNNTAMRYDAVSNLPHIAPARLRAASTEYPRAIRDTYLELPPLDPRIKRLAEQVAERGATPYDKATELTAYLQTHYGYTLNLVGPPPPDPLANFLFVRRAGHCEYFATALAVMLRTIGIPSRYATGFLPGEYNQVGGDYIVRARDAHAWVEVYFPGYGWITFDPTPPGNENPGGWLARLGLYWDWFQFTWSEWVINYDFAHQLILAHDFHRSSRAWSQRAREAYRTGRRDAIEAVKRWQLRISASPYSLPGSLVFLALLLIYFRGRAMGGFVAARWGMRARREGMLPPHLAALEYRQMLKMLERRGWKKTPAQTPLEFIAALPRAELASPVTQLTQLYLAARFGAKPADARRMSSLLLVVKERLRARKR